MSKPGLSVLLIGCPEPVVQAVRDGGHEASCPLSPEGGAAHARAGAAIDVVILDLGKAGCDPFGLAQDIRAASPPWRRPMFLALADTPDEALVARCEKAGFDLMFLAPVAPSLVAGFLGRLNAVVQDYESFDPMI